MPGDRSGDAVGVLDRMTAILEAFGEDDEGLGISQLAARAHLPKSTVSRLVASLVRQHYLERDGQQVHLGLRLFELGQLAEWPRELRAAALPIVADLRNATGLTVHLAIRDGGQMVCIAVMRGRPPVVSPVRTGGRLPLHATALGKIALAYAGAADVQATVSGAAKLRTTRTIIDPDERAHELVEIRRTGIATEREEFTPGVCCVAAPVVDRAGAPVAAISVAGAVDDIDVDHVAPAVRKAAQALTRRLTTADAARRR